MAQTLPLERPFAMVSPYIGKLVSIVVLIGALSLTLLHMPAETQEQPAAKSATATQGTPGHYTALPGSFRELLELSQKEKRGFTFIVRGQSIGGIVMQIHGEEAVEVRNQAHQRRIIRLDRVDALGIN